MMVNKRVASTNRNHFGLFEEGKNMICTEEFKMFGQLEEQADAGDIDAFVFRNGEVVPASQAENSTGPVIHTAPEKNYGQMEEVANENSNVEEFVFCTGEVVPASQVENSTGPVIHTAPEKNYAVSQKKNGLTAHNKMFTE
nr:hypothetical protein [Blautia caecimuris]